MSTSTQTLLQGPPTADPGLGLLYPYDQTVWPQGVLRRSCSGATAAHAYDGLYVQLRRRLPLPGVLHGYVDALREPPDPAERPGTRSSTRTRATPSRSRSSFTAGGLTYGPLTETWTIAQRHADRHRLLQLVRHGPGHQLLLHGERESGNFCSEGPRSRSSTARRARRSSPGPTPARGHPPERLPGVPRGGRQRLVA